MCIRVIVLLTLIFHQQAIASDFGTTGLIDIPTARMANDGMLTTNAVSQSRSKSTSITYQVTPWLEGTFRYTGINDIANFWDRNFEFKARLLKEKNYLPQIAIGIRDVTGTGYWGSEYLVASKEIGNLDLTLGMGWGRLAGDGDIKNPLINISEKFAARNNPFGLGGKLSTDAFFRGPEVGFFGGISYKLTKLPITLMVEYNPDEYLAEIQSGAPEPESPISTAIRWDISNNISTTLSYQHMQEWGIRLSAAFDTKTPPDKPSKPMFTSSLNLNQNQLPSSINKNKWYDRLLYDVERSGILLLEATLNKNSSAATIVMGNSGYKIWSDALATMVNLLDLHLPKSVKHLSIVIEEEGHRLQTIYLPRSSIDFNNSRDIIQQNIQVQPTRLLDFIQYRTKFDQRKILYNYSLSLRTQLFDPNDPLRYQVYGEIGFRMALPDDWLLRGMYAQDIYHNFDESGRVSNSVIQRVRTDILEYLTQGESGLDSLLLEKRGNVSKDIYYRVYGGILEQMYSGIGGEILYHPFQSRISYGLSANYVKQRDYDRSFKHLDYETSTAFASIYWASPFHNLDLAFHGGKYLAKDIGGTFEVRRTFNNGWMVGIWATFTDVSAADFGEGSFDKGMFFKVPLSSNPKEYNRNSFRTYLRPIQRDGGQRLEDYSGNIWWDIRGASYDAFMKTTTRTFFAGFSTKKKTSSNQNVLKYYYNEK